MLQSNHDEKQKPTMTDELLSNSVTAQALCDLLPDKTFEQWTLWLQNNRNQSRQVPYRIPFVKMAGGVFYRREELEKYSDWEKARQLGTIKLTGRAAEVLRAFSVREGGVPATGRKLNVVGVSLQVDETTKKTFIRLIAGDPLTIYRLELDEAAALGTDLLENAQAGKRISK